MGGRWQAETASRADPTPSCRTDAHIVLMVFSFCVVWEKKNRRGTGAFLRAGHLTSS